MGAWTHEPFGNDDAADWVADLVESKNLTAIEGALNAVTEEAEEYLEAPQCAEALAAAEVVAALLAHPSASLPEKAAKWVKGKAAPSSALVAKAQRAVAAILKASELQELWAESEDYSQWQTVTKDLLARLG